MFTREDIETMAEYFSVIHHIPGRLRVRVDPAIAKRESTVNIETIKALPDTVKGIKRIKINKIVGSVVVEYDNTLFPKLFWEDLIAGRNTQSLAEKFQALKKPTDSI